MHDDLKALEQHYLALSDDDLARAYAAGRDGFASDAVWRIVQDAHERRGKPVLLPHEPADLLPPDAADEGSRLPLFGYRWMLLAVALMIIPSIAVVVTGLDNPLLPILAARLAVAVVLSRKLLQGRNWARIVAGVLLGVTGIWQVLDAVAYGFALIAVLGVGYAGVGAALLFNRSVRAVTSGTQRQSTPAA
jgi:hypothetical protein